MRYWVVLSFGLLIELCLDKVEGFKLTCVKVCVLLWCLAPVDNNGSDLIFRHVILPLHQGGTYIATEATAFLVPIMKWSATTLDQLSTYLFDEILLPLSLMVKYGAGVAFEAACSAV